MYLYGCGSTVSKFSVFFNRHARLMFVLYSAMHTDFIPIYSHRNNHSMKQVFTSTPMQRVCSVCHEIIHVVMSHEDRVFIATAAAAPASKGRSVISFYFSMSLAVSRMFHPSFVPGLMIHPNSFSFCDHSSGSKCLYQ